MDPPSYGRGPKGEIWKIEEKIYPFIELCTKILSDDPLFFLVNSYTTGLQPAVLTYMLETQVAAKFGGKVVSDEIGLPSFIQRIGPSMVGHLDAGKSKFLRFTEISQNIVKNR